MITPGATLPTINNDLLIDGRVSDGYRHFLRDEYEANKIEWFQNMIVPGLLQTEAYARAMSRLHWPATATQKEIDAWVMIRLQTQWEIFGRQKKPKLHFIIDEAALYRQLGGADVLYEQLVHLLKLIDVENMMIQVLPIREGGELYPYPISCFTILGFAAKNKKAALYCDYPLDYTRRLEMRSDLFLYERLFTRLSAIARGQEQTKEYIQKAIKTLDESNSRPRQGHKK